MNNNQKWIDLSNQILSTEPNCQCTGCKNKASVIRQLVFKRVDNIKASTDILPVCTSCNSLIQKAIDNNYIPRKTSPKFSIEDIHRLSIGIKKDIKYKSYCTWLNTSHYLKQELIDRACKLSHTTFKQISGIIKEPIYNEEDLKKHKFTGRQIEQVDRIVRVAENRLKNKIEKKSRKSRKVY